MRRALMVCIAGAALLGASACAQNPQAGERWAEVGQDNGASIHVDMQTIVKRDTRARAWYRVAIAGGAEYVLLEFKCNDRTYRNIRDGQDERGDEWRLVVPESVTERIFHKACKERDG